MVTKILGRAIAFTRAPVIIALVCFSSVQGHASDSLGTLTVQLDKPGAVINRDVFGQFAEHLGEGIYGGIWVGRDSKIPNVRGIRSDVVAALKAIKVPVVRWPGGCYADKYHWRDGVGPDSERRVALNSIWGGATEANTFGTHEFMDFLEQVGSEPYVSVNIGSGSVAEAADWLEYMTTDQPTELGKERVANGRAEPWTMKYIGMGNEMWGCGGGMSADNYVEHMKKFVLHVDSQHPTQVSTDFIIRNPKGSMRIASGDGGLGNEYTEAVMKAWKARSPWFWSIEGISMHHYTWGENMLNSLPYGFSEKEYAGLLEETYEMDELIAERSEIMDKYDPGKEVALVVDEWGVWLKPEPGLNPRFLKQQTSMRDAIAASININIFARHADRVRMANIAQMVNVLQGMILTENEKMVLTPTYHIFKMYVPFQDAQFIPIDYSAGTYTFDEFSMPRVDAIAARGKDGKIWLALANLDPHRVAQYSPNVPGVSVNTAVGQVLTAPRMDSINTYAAPNTVAPRPIRAEAVDGKLLLDLPPNSVTVVRLES